MYIQNICVCVYICVCIYIEREREREREKKMIKKKLDREKWGAKRREGRYLRREAEWKGVTVDWRRRRWWPSDQREGRESLVIDNEGVIEIREKRDSKIRLGGGEDDDEILISFGQRETERERERREEKKVKLSVLQRHTLQQRRKGNGILMMMMMKQWRKRER
jgi:hypothetical protein